MEGFENQEEFQNQTENYSYGTNESADTYTETNYGCGDEENGWYRPYQEPPKPKRQKNGYAKKLFKNVILAFGFGIAAGIAFLGTTYFFGNITGRNAAPEQEKGISGADLMISEETEAVDMADRTDGGAQMAAEGAVTDVSEIVGQSMPSIVSITTIAKNQTPGFFFGQTEEYESQGSGSGIIVSQDEENLYIATNNHVVAGAQTLTVIFADDSSVNASIKGADSSSDLAVVSVPLEEIEDETKKNIRAAVFGQSDTLKIGQTAIAIGNALGYGQSVTTGVISALDREVTVTSETDGKVITNELVQTSAAINPGNSGGALLNIKGEVIGITSVKYSETSVEGMGYAIPSETAIPIIRQLITREVVSGSDSAYLGVSGVDVTQSISDTYHMPQGVYVAHIVEGSAAAESGLMQGDIINRFDGRNITSMNEIRELMKYLPAGTEVDVTVYRAQNGEYKEQELKVTLGSKN